MNSQKPPMVNRKPQNILLLMKTNEQKLLAYLNSDAQKNKHIQYKQRAQAYNLADITEQTTNRPNSHSVTTRQKILSADRGISNERKKNSNSLLKMHPLPLRQNDKRFSTVSVKIPQQYQSLTIENSKQNLVVNQTFDQIDKEEFTFEEDQILRVPKKSFITQTIQNLKKPASKENQGAKPPMSQTEQQEHFQYLRKAYFKQQRIFQKFSLNFGEESQIYSVRYNPTDSYIAIGCGDGSIKILNNQRVQVSQRLVDEEETNLSSITAVRWCPITQSHSLGSRDTLVTTSCSGKIIVWDRNGDVLHRIKDESNHLNTCEFTCDGTKFMTGGQDGVVRVYNYSNPQDVDVFQQKKGKIPGHTNRIFAIKSHDENPNLFFSAGWDSRVNLWDIRTSRVESYLHGPLVCGDSLDYQNDMILTGSWRQEKQLEIWDFQQMRKVQDLPWDTFTNQEERTYIYSCQFTKNYPYNVIAGSTGTYSLRYFDSFNNYKCCDIFQEGIKKGVFSLDWANTKSQLAFGCSDGKWGNVDVL